MVSQLRANRRFFVSLLCAVLLALLSVTTGAATLTVTSLADDSDPGTLRNVIDGAFDGDTVIFDTGFTNINITLADTIPIDRSLTIQPGDPDQNITINAPAGKPAFEISGNASVNLDEMTISVRDSGASAINTTVNTVTLNLSEVTISGNKTANTTGINNNAGTLTMDRVTISEMSTNTGASAVNSVVANGTVNITNSTFRDNLSGPNGALWLGGTVSLVDVDVLDNDSSSASGTIRGTGLTLDLPPSGSTTATIRRSGFINNTGTAGTQGAVYVENNVTATFDSSTIARSRNTSGLKVASGGVANLAFTTITLNAAAGINAEATATVNYDSIINWDNANACLGSGTFTPQDANVIEGGNTAGCGNDSTSGVFLIDDDPQLIPFSGDVTRYELSSTSSAALDRATNLEYDFGGGPQVSNRDISNGFRPQNLGRADIGSAELFTIDDDAPRGQLTVIVTGDTDIREGETTTISLSLASVVDPIPGVGVQITLEDLEGECRFGSLNPSDPVTLTSTPVDVTVLAFDDTNADGIHNCDIRGTTAATQGTYTDGFYDGIQITPIEITVQDNDADEEPALNPFDLSAFTPPMVEGDPARNMIVSVASPPRGTVNIELDDARDECEFPDGGSDLSTVSLTIDASNYEGETVRVRARRDNDVELSTNHFCDIFARYTYTYLDNSGNSVTTSVANTSTGTSIIQLGADPDQRIQFVLPGTSTPVNSTTLAEGQTYNLGVQTTRSLGGTSERYVIILGSNSGECLFSATGTREQQIDLSSSDDDAVVQLFIPTDGNPGEPSRTCTIGMTYTTGTTDDTIPTDTFLVNVSQDGVANPSLIINDEVQGGQLDGTNPGAITPVLVEGETDGYTLEITLDRNALSSQTVQLQETSSNPSGNANGQCSLQDINNNDIEGDTLTVADGSGNRQSITVYLRAIDDPFAENAPHNCTYSVNFNGSTASAYSFTATINDDDAFKIYPNPDTENIRVIEGVRRQVIYTLTNPTNVDTTITFVPVDGEQICEIRNSSGTEIETLTIDANDSDASEPIFLFVAQNGRQESDRLCRYNVQLLSGSPAYEAEAAAAQAAGEDYITPIFARVSDTEPTDDDPVATEEPDGSTSASDTTPTPQPFDEEGLEILQTLTPVPTPTPLPDPYLTLAAEVRRLNVRTGPYLGASLVTVVLEGPSGTDTLNGETNLPSQRFPILAKNRDETAEVFWYYINANGYNGWVSGRSVSLDLNSDGVMDVTPDTAANTLTGEISGATSSEDGQASEAGVAALGQWNTIPFRGSIFDEIEGAPNLNVGGTLTRERNVHRRPSRRAGVIGSLPAGAQVSIVGRTREITYDDWYQIQFGGGTGWVEAESTAENPAIIVNPELVRQRVPVR